MESIKQLISIQEDRFCKINKAQLNYHKTPKSRISFTYLNARLESLERIIQSFIYTHDQIISSINKEDMKAFEYFQNDIYDEAQELYFIYKGELKNKILELTPQDSSTQPTLSNEREHVLNSTAIKLPTINLPIFSGKYTEWTSFYDLFTSIIHNNNNLDNVQKLHYLKSSLTGEAEQLLRTVATTHDNYIQAWTTLQKRYNNKRYISNSIFKRLFGLKAIVADSAYHMKQLLDTTIECLNLLYNVGINTKEWDSIIIYMTVTKLDSESHRMWEQNLSLETDQLPSFEMLKQFMESRFRSLEMIEPSKLFKPKSFHTINNSIKCILCAEDHYLYNCKQFAKKSFIDRYEFVRNNNLCFNCFIPSHVVTNCTKTTFCRICNKKHHSLLHENFKSSEESVKQENHEDSKDISTHFLQQPGQVLLATALVDITTKNGQTLIYRTLIDQGSQASFVTENLVQTCGLKRVRINGLVAGLSDGKQLRTKYMVEFDIKSRYKPHLIFRIKAYVLKTLTTYTPSQEISVSNWPDLEKITLADPGYNKPKKIDLLLGAEVFSKILDNGYRKSPCGIIAQYTHLGWILSGETCDRQPATNKRFTNIHICTCDNEIIKKFWEIENETTTSKRKYTTEEEQCENIYKKSVKRNTNGRYIVTLPFKNELQDPINKCGNTKTIATARFLQLERKFNHNIKLKNDYKNVVHEYLELGHMRLLEEDTENGIYLPHHAVVRNDKDTTKVRVVFDASAKGSKGFSLNDTLIIGPTIQKDLFTLITEWRKFKIAIVGDIVKMYRQVLVNEENTKFQRIIWRDNTNEDLKCYELLTVTFGTASAPYLATRTLLQLAEDEGHNYPLAANILKQSFYVDDLMTGCHDKEEGITIYKQLTRLLNSGGFEMQKWSSNSEELLNLIKQEKNISNNQSMEIKQDQHIKILGIIWDRNNDKFKFKVSLQELVEPITKRKILSEIAKLFDPFGWISPTIIIAKILIQKLWLCNSDWDEEVPSHILNEWTEFREQLHELEKVQIDRWFHTYPGTHIELHGFADASMLAYASVIYVKVIRDDKIHISLLESKTKVSPLKQISVARLELCAAVLLAKLMSKSMQILNVPADQVYAYTDSMIVLAWIQSQPMRWQTFVGNRVTEIQNLLRNDRWFHIKSEDNPADLASRGIYSSELVNKAIWWKGPSWLVNRNTCIRKRIVPETELEQKQIKIKTHHNQIESPIWERFSTLNKMIRVLTYCRRFLRLKEIKTCNKKPTNYLNSKELKDTLMTCIKAVQNLDFNEEIMDLKEKNKIKRRSKLISLSPYLDTEGILCVGGRLQNAKVAPEVKHPIILSQTSHLTWLIVKEAHAKLLHGGYALMINYLRGRYWILGLKNLVKKCVRQCVTCIRHKAITLQPLMGILPEVRVNPGRPFECSGVDYAGPIYMRTTKGRGYKAYKGYICLFICMKTRAIHIEAVSDLTSSGFLAAFRRFTSRRGHCSELWSDNGSNFVGAAKELSDMLNIAKRTFTQEVNELLSNDGTKWKFIPPRAPNFGGLWEAGIKMVKTHLTKVIGNTKLTYEEMSTLLSQIEACLNSRPICQISEHPDDLTPLTPAHFLVGEPLVLIPDKKYEDQSITPLERWRLVQKMTQHFWQRWSKEFLHTLQQRTKWHSKAKHPLIGDLVIIKEENIPPTKWLMGKIVEIHKGQDNEVRILTLKTQTSILKRQLSKVILLPSDSNAKSNLEQVS